MRRNIELEARLIDDLLDLTRITRGKLELRCERVRLHRIIEDATNACLPDLEAKHLNLVRDFASEKATILADSARITQILWNLLKNAIKLTPEGGTITVRWWTMPADGVATLKSRTPASALVLNNLTASLMPLSRAIARLRDSLAGSASVSRSARPSPNRTRALSAC